MNKLNEIDQLIYLFSKLPSLGQRSARRIVLHLLQEKDVRLKGLISALSYVDNNVVKCDICGNIDSHHICRVCSSDDRNKSIIAIVETVTELWAIERSGIFNGYYHVLGHNLSTANSHCSLMKPAEEQMAKALDKVVINKPFVPVVQNVTAKPTTNPIEIKQNLISQICGRVRWRQTLNELENLKIEQIVEIGAGKVLTNMLRKTDHKFDLINISSLVELEKFLKIM